MTGDLRTRIADNVALRAEIGGKEILLSEDHIRALGGILQGDLAGAAPELRFLFDAGILEIGAARPPAPEKLAALVLGDADSTIHLDPCTDIRVSLVGEGFENPIAASQLYSAFIPPRTAAALVRLAQRLKAAGKAMHRNEATRNKPVQLADWLRVLESIYRESIERTELAESMRVVPDTDRHFRLELSEPLQRNECTWPEARVRIHRCGTPEAARMSVPVASRDLPAIATLLRSLCKGVRRSELLALLAASSGGAALARVVDALARSRAFGVAAQERPDWDALLPTTAILSALHLGHAGLLVRGGESSILVDPWFLHGHPDYRVQPLQAAQLPPVEAIFLTHEHWDHVNDATLLRYPADVPVFVPKQDSGAPLHPRYREYLEMFGIGQVIELAHWEQHALPSGLIVTAIPFRGEGTAEECAVRNCYLFERSDKRIFVHVDSSIDTYGESDLTDGTIDRMVATYGPIDILFATRRQELHFAYEIFSDLAPLFFGPDPRRFLDIVENCNCPASYLAELARATHCSELVLYSEGGAEWYDDSTNFLRSDNSDASLGYDHLWDKLEQIVAAVPCPVRLSAPHDRFSIEAEGIAHASSLEGGMNCASRNL